jgi:hypothetical protein
MGSAKRMTKRPDRPLSLYHGKQGPKINLPRRLSQAAQWMIFNLIKLSTNEKKAKHIVVTAGSGCKANKALYLAVLALAAGPRH